MIVVEQSFVQPLCWFISSKVLSSHKHLRKGNASQRANEPAATDLHRTILHQDIGTPKRALFFPIGFYCDAENGSSRRFQPQRAVIARCGADQRGIGSPAFCVARGASGAAIGSAGGSQGLRWLLQSDHLVV